MIHDFNPDTLRKTLALKIKINQAIKAKADDLAKNGTKPDEQLSANFYYKLIQQQVAASGLTLDDFQLIVSTDLLEKYLGYARGQQEKPYPNIADEFAPGTKSS